MTEVEMLKSPFHIIINKECIAIMSLSFNRCYWPFLAFFIFREKLDGKEYKGLTRKDFINTMFSQVYSKQNLYSLLQCALPMIKKEESLYNRTIYTLTPYGKWVGKKVWIVLTYVTKKFGGESIEKYVQRLIRMRNLEPDPAAIDEETLLIKKLDENNIRIQKENARKAGILKTQTFEDEVK